MNYPKNTRMRLLQQQLQKQDFGIVIHATLISQTILKTLPNTNLRMSTQE
jgi:hypothetical protein